MNGKSKCKILKEIRREIARNNDIEFITSECTFQGECSGTCPKCEAELRYLEQALEKRRHTGKAVAVAGIAAALVVTATGCSLDDFFPSSDGLMGSAVDSYNFADTAGAPMADPAETKQPEQQEVVLAGDIAYVPDIVPGELPDPG